MSEIPNPYIAGSPVTGPEMFFGREDAFASIRQALTGQHRDNVLVLYGQRRTGKTSVLYQMSRHLDARYLCVFIDLQGLALDSLGGFLWELANYVARALRRQYQINLPPLNHDEFMADPRSAFENGFLDAVWSSIGDRHLLLMLDEAVRLQEKVRAGKLEQEVFEYLRHLMQHYDRLNFLFSLGSGLEEMEQEYSFLFNVALYKKISFLTREAAIALITQPVEGYYKIEPQAIERILSLTSGHPYYTQLLCHSLFNRSQEQHLDVVNVADVETVLDEVVERGLAVLKYVWDESTPGEKAVMVGMMAAMGETNRPVGTHEIGNAWAKLDVALPDGQVATAIQSLIARDIIAGGEQYKFTVDLQRLWVQKYRRLEWVKEEIAEALQAWAQAAESPPVTPPGQAPDSASSHVPAPSSGYSTKRTGVIITNVPPALFALGAVVLLAFVGLVLFFIMRATPAAPVTPSGDGGRVVPGGDAAKISDMAVASNAVWAATEGGLVRWHSDGTSQVFHGTDLGFPSECMQTVAVAGDGTLWTGCGGVAHARPEGDQLVSLGYYNRDDGLGMGVTNALLIDTDGTVWAGGKPDPGRNPPLSHFDGKSHADGRPWRTDEPLVETLVQQGVQINIWSLLRSRDGALWLGLAQDGILRWDGHAWTHYGHEQGVGGAGDADDRIRRLVQDRNGTVWAAASDSGLLRFDAGQGHWVKAAVLEDNQKVRGIVQFTDGGLWASGDGIIARSTDGGATWTQVGTDSGLGQDIATVVQDATGQVWAGAYDGGISLLQGGTWRALQH